MGVMKMELRKDKIMGRVLTEGEKEKQAFNIGVTNELMKNLLGKEKINIYDFAIKHMKLKHYDYEQVKEIQKNLSNEELEKFPSMGLDMGVFQNNQNEYISVYDIGDIRLKSIEMAKEWTETIQDLITGNHEVENSKNAVDTLKVHFKWSERFSQENIIFEGNEAVEFLNKLIEADNIYSEEREINDQDSEEDYLPYYKTKLAIEYSGVKYDIERIDLGDGIYKDLKSFTREREENFQFLSNKIEKLRSVTSDKIVDDFKNNYSKLFQEMKDYNPQKQEFKTSGEAFREVKKVLSEKEMKMEEIKANLWKKNNGKDNDKER